MDVIADLGPKLMPIEIKSGQTLNRDFFTGLERWQALAGDLAASPALIYGGTETRTHRGVNVYAWAESGRVLRPWGGL